MKKYVILTFVALTAFTVLPAAFRAGAGASSLPSITLWCVVELPRVVAFPLPTPFLAALARSGDASESASLCQLMKSGATAEVIRERIRAKETAGEAAKKVYLEHEDPERPLGFSIRMGTDPETSTEDRGRYYAITDMLLDEGAEVNAYYPRPLAVETEGKARRVHHACLGYFIQVAHFALVKKALVKGACVWPERHPADGVYMLDPLQMCLDSIIDAIKRREAPNFNHLKIALWLIAYTAESDFAKAKDYIESKKAQLITLKAQLAGEMAACCNDIVMALDYGLAHWNATDPLWVEGISLQTAPKPA